MRFICPLHGYFKKENKNSRCPKCTKDYDKKDRNQESKKIYNNSKWRNEVRPQVLLRDAARCVQCDSKENLVVDHKIELVDGGDAYDLDNLETLCKKCHATKTYEAKKKRK